MSEVATARRTEEMGIDTTAPFRSPDATSTAELALEEALTFCARKAGLEEAQAVVERLRQGDSTVHHYCRYGLAKKMAESIGSLDDNVKAVYTLDYDATPEDRCFGSEAHTSPTHLIVWAARKTDALTALVKALDRALVEAYADLIDAPQLTHMLDVQVVDDADVEERTGYGALLSSIHNRPIQVWER
ncbi:MAG: hypothetical protein KGY78_09530 [Anaerolineae bacterium]|nr:hypothetical protein [Anaerolineae bacterium]